MVQVSSLVVAQITDIHLFSEAHQQLLGLPTADSFQAVVAQLKALKPRPDLLLLTGDLSQDGKPASYARLQQLLVPLNIPVYWLPGNHDCLPTMEQALAHPLVSPKKSFLAGNWRFLLLNSQVPGCVHGHLSQNNLDWLEQQLYQDPEHPTLVALHHPPFQVHSDWLDSSTLRNPEDLFAVLHYHPQVKLVVFGHIHQEFSRCHRNVTYLGSPSTSIQFEPESQHFSLGQQTPGFRLFSLHSDGTWDSQVKRVAYAHCLDLAATGY